MASITLKSVRAFPAGTTVNAYKASDWPTWKQPPTGAPPGVSVTSGVVAADGTLVLTGVTEGVTYFAYAQVGGVDRYVAFTPEAITPLRALDRDLGLGAVFAPMMPFPAQLGSLTVAGSTIYLVRFVPSRNMAITKLAFAVTTAASTNDNCDAGILDSAGNRLGSSGATAGKLNALGSPSVPFTAINLVAGSVYFAALAIGVLGGTAAVIQGMTDGTFRLNSLLNAGASDNRTFSLSFAANPTVPASLTLTAGTSAATGPILAAIE